MGVPSSTQVSIGSLGPTVLGYSVSASTQAGGRLVAAVRLGGHDSHLAGAGYPGSGQSVETGAGDLLGDDTGPKRDDERLGDNSGDADSLGSFAHNAGTFDIGSTRNRCVAFRNSATIRRL